MGLITGELHGQLNELCVHDRIELEEKNLDYNYSSLLYAVEQLYLVLALFEMKIRIINLVIAQELHSYYTVTTQLLHSNYTQLIHTSVSVVTTL